jgi:ABC-2 type transport system permease protein
MKKFFALIHARNLEFYRDRTAMAWTLLFPFIVLAGFHYGYSGKNEPLIRLIVSPESAAESPVIQSMKDTPGLEFRTTNDADAALKKLERFEIDFVISVTENGKRLSYSLNKDSEKGRLAEKILTQTSRLQTDSKITLEQKEVSGKKVRYSDWLLPGLLAMNIMFGSMFGVGYVIVRYRKNGVLKRLRATPLSAFQFLTAQVASRMLLMIFTSLLVIGGAMILIGFKPSLGAHASHWIDLICFIAVSSAAMISVGLLIAARISSEEVADGVLNLMTWPMIFLSGIWFSLDGASVWVEFIAKLLPLTHVVKGLRAILIDGATFSQLMPEVTILAAVTAVLVTVGSAIFRWR